MLFLLQFSNFRFASRDTKICKKYYSTPSSNILDPDLFGLDPDPTLYLEDTESNTSTTLRNSLNYLLVKKKIKFMWFQQISKHVVLKISNVLCPDKNNLL